ncbi:hypothetical protein MFIFM68171_04734 [Madurella fahalii]|uniref:F-box domain-containing protein n=1 Tax=Madurella fahalii TaxID=1157608 RepID=A0ABQ0G9X9_9PEZI
MDRVLQSDATLELIFLLLDHRTLLTSVIRVCRQWRSVVCQSTPLQQRLFFDPIITGSSGEADRQLNPLLQEYFPLWFQLPKYRPGVWAGFAHQPTAIASNPPVRQGRREALTRRGASWRRMLVQQPPLYRLGVIIADRAYFTDILDFPDGLRMGALYDLVYSYACHNDNPASWCMAWNPSLSGEDELSFDDTVGAWMGSRDIALALYVINFDSWAASLLELADQRLEGEPVDWGSFKSEDHEELQVKPQFYFLPR